MSKNRKKYKKPVSNLKPIAPNNKDADGKEMGDFKCLGCQYEGQMGELLGEDDDETLRCPICETSAIEYV